MGILYVSGLSLPFSTGEEQSKSSFHYRGHFERTIGQIHAPNAVVVKKSRVRYGVVPVLFLQCWQLDFRKTPLRLR